MKPPTARIPELDGIRGVAVLTILVYHWFILENRDVLPHKLFVIGSFGWIGVDLFFVLSGFLIGGILLDTKDSPNYFSVFYKRRAFRILPLYCAAYLLALCVFYLPLAAHPWLLDKPLPWYEYAVFGQNFWLWRAHVWGGAQG